MNTIETFGAFLLSAIERFSHHKISPALVVIVFVACFFIIGLLIGLVLRTL